MNVQRGFAQTHNPTRRFIPEGIVDRPFGEVLADSDTRDVRLCLADNLACEALYDRSVTRSESNPARPQTLEALLHDQLRANRPRTHRSDWRRERPPTTVAARRLHAVQKG